MVHTDCVGLSYNLFYVCISFGMTVVGGGFIGTPNGGSGVGGSGGRTTFN